ncbi:MAG: anti-sigma factor family protein [Rhodoblastus sp.]
MTRASRVSDAELHAFVDGQLNDERALAIAVWLAEHPRDGQRVDGWRAHNEAIQRAFPPLARERIALAFRAAESDAPLKLPITPAIEAYRANRRRRRNLSLILAFVAGALAAILLTTVYLKTAGTSAPNQIFASLIAASDNSGRRARDENPTARMADEIFAHRAAAAWRTYAQDTLHPVEVEARDMAGLTKWLKARTGLENPPALADARLIGGRVLPGQGQNAAFLLYRLASGEFVALLAERGASGADDYADVGVFVRSWTRGGFRYALAGALPERRIAALAGELEAPR